MSAACCEIDAAEFCSFIQHEAKMSGCVTRRLALNDRNAFTIFENKILREKCGYPEKGKSLKLTMQYNGLP
jgi:hypothetical protein